MVRTHKELDLKVIFNDISPKTTETEPIISLY